MTMLRRIMPPMALRHGGLRLSISSMDANANAKVVKKIPIGG